MNTSRSTKCSKSGTVDPSSTGPLGMRNRAASARSSAVDPPVVCSCTAAGTRPGASSAPPTDQVGVLHHVGATDQEAEVLELLRAVGRDHTQPSAVGTIDGTSTLGRCRGSAASRGISANTDGKVDMVTAMQSSIATSTTSPRPVAAAPRAAARHRGVGAGHPLAEPAARRPAAAGQAVPDARSNRHRPGG